MRTPNSPAGKATREQILEVTLDFIQREGLASLTIRKIAERAGVNVAAVNYHFGSKEALVNEVLVVLTAGLRGAFAHLADGGALPRQRLRRFLDAFSTALLQHPEVYRQAIAVNLAGGDAQRQYFSFVRSEGIRALLDTVRAATGETDDRRLRLRVIQGIGGLVYPLLVGPFIEQVAGLHLADEAVRREHVSVCLETLVGPGADAEAPATSTDRTLPAPAGGGARRTKRRS